MKAGENEQPKINLTVIDDNHFKIDFDGDNINGVVGELINKNDIAIKVDKINAMPGTEFTISYVSRLQAITDLLDVFSVADIGKDTGMLSLSLTGDNPLQIEKIINSISNNYLAQNISRQAAQDAKSLDF